MGFIIQSDKKRIRLERSGKILKAGDVSALWSAEQIATDAEKRRTEILNAAISAFEYEQIRGYQEGRAAALKEQASKMASTITQTVEYFGRIEQKISDLVLNAVKKIISELSEEEKILNTIRSALDLVRSQTTIMIRVNPSNIEFVESHLSIIKKKYPSINHIEVVQDATILNDACIIDSEIGRIESSISGQLEALAESIKNTFGNHDSEDFNSL